MLSVCSRRVAQLQRVSREPFWKMVGGSYLQSGYWHSATPRNTDSQPELLEWKSYMQTTRNWNYEMKIVKLQVYVLVKTCGRAAIDQSLHNITLDILLVLVYALKYWLVC